MYPRNNHLLLWLVLILANLHPISAQGTLEAGFQDPPTANKPRTWMHSMSGNASKAGMTKDLEAIAAAGEGGVLLFDVTYGIPYGEVAYDSPKHHAIIKHAAAECERLGLSFGVHNCDGWSSSGGPWILPEESMKIIVQRDTVVQLAGGTFSLPLAQPTIREGYYEDIAVLAYPALATEVADAEVTAVVTASDPDFDVGIVTDAVAEKVGTLHEKEEETAWLQFDYGQPHTVRSVNITHTQRLARARLETSDDGNNWTFVTQLNNIRVERFEYRFIQTFEPVTARYFRINFSEAVRLKEVTLSATQLVDNFEGFSGRGFIGTSELGMISPPQPGMVVKKGSIMNLTGKLRANGTLKATLPPGTWTIMRFGVTTTAVKNAPASKWGRGLECDKLNRPAFKKHWDNFVQEVIDNTRQIAPNAMQYVEIDSYEMGGQNWTDGFDTIYKRRKGYDLIPFLPLIAGRYVDDLPTTKGVLWDLNDLLCDLMTENYYQYFTELCHENGIQSYTEPYGKGHVNQFDVTGVTDLPMTEFWMGKDHNYVPSVVSAAHIYGKNIISAESFTSHPELNWKMHPALAKSAGDKAWAEGVNEFMFHRYAHQPNTHVKPGMTMAKWGSHIDRTQTWWMNAGKAWFSYIARGSYLLRQGYPAVDVLVFAGDVSHNADVLPKNLTVKIPAGLNYDCTNADVLINRITLRDKKMVLPEGNAYSHLVLQNMDYVELATLRRIKEIVEAGVIVTGDKPGSPAGYVVSPEQQREFDQLVLDIWKNPGYRADFDFSRVKADLELVGKDQLFVHRKTDREDIYFFSNETSDARQYEAVFRVVDKIPELWDAETGQITKLACFNSETDGTRVWLELGPLESAFVIFRESATDVPHLDEANFANGYHLDADNRLVVTTAENGKFWLPLAGDSRAKIKTNKLPDAIDLSTDWQVAFLAEHDYAATENFPTLTDWKDNAKEGIKHYSGTATYTKTVNLNRYKPDTKVYLDLGDVSVVAGVIINGKPVSVLWKAPFRTEISDQLQQGENLIEVKVTNQWANRLIGDEHYPVQDGGYSYVGQSPPKADNLMPKWFVDNEPMPAGPRTTFTTLPAYTKEDPLLSSGLLGPVRITFKKEITVK